MIFSLGHNVDLTCFRHKLPCDVLYLPGHRRGEKRYLLILRRHCHYFSYIINKAHLEHLVSLIKDKGIDVRDVHHLTLNHIDKTSGSGYDHLGLLLYLLRLEAHALASDKRSHLKVPYIFCKAFKFCRDLQCEFTCRAQYKCLNEPCIHVEIFQDRDAESKCLACSRRSLGNDTVVVHKKRYGFLLYGGGPFYAHLL